MQEIDFGDNSSDVQVLDNQFLAFSENGIISSSLLSSATASGSHRKSSAPGAWGSLRWT